MNAKKLFVNAALGIATFSAGALLPMSGVTAEVTLPYQIKGEMTCQITDYDESIDAFKVSVTDEGIASFTGRYSNSGIMWMDRVTTVFFAGSGTCVPPFARGTGDVSDWHVEGDKVTGIVTMFFDGGTGRFVGDSGYAVMTPTSAPVFYDETTFSLTYVGSGYMSFVR